MSQDELAHAMGYKDRSMITKIEAGKVDISQKKILAFARVLNTTTAYLMGTADEQARPFIIPDNDKFHKVIEAMSAEDYYLVMDAFERTYQRMKANGEID